MGTKEPRARGPLRKRALRTRLRSHVTRKVARRSPGPGATIKRESREVGNAIFEVGNPQTRSRCLLHYSVHTERHDDQSRRHALTRTPQGRTTRIGNRTTEVRNAKPHANAELQFRTHTHSHERKGTNFWRTQRGAECGPKTPPLGQTGATTRSRHPSRGNDLNLGVACARQGPRLAAELKRSTKMTIFHPKCEETQTSAHRRHYRIRKSPIHAMQRTPAAKDLKLLLYWWISQSLGKTYPRATAGF